MINISKTIILRCDYFEGSGAGHLKRTNILKSELEKRGYKTILLIDDSPIEINFPIIGTYEKIRHDKFDELRDANFVKDIASKNNASLIIGDSYRITNKWVNKLKDSGLIVVLIDDHGMDYLSDLTINYTPLNKMEPICSTYKQLRGPKYFITDSKFSRTKTNLPKKIVAHAGGLGNFSKAKFVYKILAEIADQESIQIDWICPSSQSEDSLKNIVHINENDRIIGWNNNSRELWTNYQIVVGPASTSLYEAIIQGTLPISFQISNTQSTELKDWISIGHSLHISNSYKENEFYIKEIINIAISKFKYFKKALNNYSKELDGKGLERVVFEIERLLKNSTNKNYPHKLINSQSGVKSCDFSYSFAYLEARNTKDVRGMSTNPNHIITWPEHLRWWIKGSTDKYVFIGNSNIPEAFFWVKEWKIQNKNYITAGWFPANKNTPFTSILKVVDWQIKNYSKKNNSYKWVATVHNSNKAALAINKRFGFVDASPETNNLIPILFPGTTKKFKVLELLI